MSTESQIRLEKINIQLNRAGWSVGSRDVIEEYLIRKGDSVTKDPSEKYSPSNEFADYVLFDRFRKPIAIVEAKRSSRSAIE